MLHSLLVVFVSILLSLLLATNVSAFVATQRSVQVFVRSTPGVGFGTTTRHAPPPNTDQKRTITPLWSSFLVRLCRLKCLVLRKLARAWQTFLLCVALVCGSSAPPPLMHHAGWHPILYETHQAMVYSILCNTMWKNQIASKEYDFFLDERDNDLERDPQV